MRMLKVYYNPACDEIAVVQAGYYFDWIFMSDWQYVIRLGEL